MMSNSDVINRLARACAHGHRQLEFVNELLAGEGYARLVQIPVYGGTQAVVFGDARVGGRSWMSLKKRLVANGFMVKMGEWDKKNYRTVTLRFSV